MITAIITPISTPTTSQLCQIRTLFFRTSTNLLFLNACSALLTDSCFSEFISGPYNSRAGNIYDYLKTLYTTCIKPHLKYYLTSRLIETAGMSESRPISLIASCVFFKINNETPNTNSKKTIKLVPERIR